MAQSGLPHTVRVGNDTSIAIGLYFERSIENINIYYLSYLQPVCDSVEQACQNKLGTKPSFKS